MSWRLTYAAAAERDFALIFDHLLDSYQTFGESRAEALHHAERRLLAIVQDAERIGTAPQRGSRHDDLLPGLRCLTLGKVSFWFTADAGAGEVHILALLWGGQDQQRRMLIRLLDGA